MLADMLQVEGLESAEAGSLKQDEDRHHFAHTQGRLPLPGAPALGYLARVELGDKLAAELVTIIEQA